MGRSILVASGKGGSGKTTFAIAMALTLARQGNKVCILDLNFGLRNVDIYLGLEDRIIFDLGDIFSGVCKVDKALVKADAEYGELYLLESTQNKIIKGITEGHIKALVNQLKKQFDYVIMDSPAAVGSDINLIAGAADSAVLILNPDPLALRNTDAVDKRLISSGVKSRCFIINMVRFDLEDNEFGPGIDDMAKVLEMPMAGIIPFDENIQIGNNLGKPVFTAADSYIAKNVEGILDRMLGEQNNLEILSTFS